MQGIKEKVQMQNLISNDQQYRSSPPALQTMGLDYFGIENGGNNSLRPGATGEENSLRPGKTGKKKYRRVNRMVENKGSPGVTREGSSLRADTTGEEKYRRVQWMVENRGSPPGATGEGNFLRGGATREENSLRVHMFDKVVTPSDVGKLNRLVIPKHQAQKYFPLERDEKERGLLLTFEDNMGKEWMFRYSYWSSSQSYVFTKGWNRFVRQMDLRAGDVVSFHTAAAGRNIQQHFYISWRRRSSKEPLLRSSLRRGQTRKLCQTPYLISSLAALQYSGGAAMPSSTSLPINGGAAMASLPIYGSAAVAFFPNNGGAAVASLPNNGGVAVTSNLPVEERNGLESTVTGHLIAGGGLGQNCDEELNAPLGQLNPGERPAGVVSYPAQNTAAAGSGKTVRIFGVTL